MKRFKQFNKYKLGKKFNLSMACVGVLCSIGAVSAEETSNAEKGTEQENIEVIEVRGIFASSAKNLALKRTSGAVVDAITAEDVGKFPDRNVADSLQRVPGVIIGRDGGEGSNVSIRGLSPELTFTQLNGNYIASATRDNPGRSFNYSLLPSTMISMAEVYKSPQAHMDEGGVGGTVILHTRKPLDMEANSGVFSFDMTKSDVSDETDPAFSGLYSWKNDSETFGALVGYTHQKRLSKTMGMNSETWRWWADDADNNPAVTTDGKVVDNVPGFGAITAANGKTFDGFWAPQSMNASIKTQQREREGTQLSLQWLPTDELELGFNYFRFNVSDNFSQQINKIPEWGLNCCGPDLDIRTFDGDSMVFDDSGTILQAVTYRDDIVGDGSSRPLLYPFMTGTASFEESTSETFDFNIAYIGDDFEASVVFGHTKANGGPDELFETAYTANNWGLQPNVNGNSLAAWDISSGDLAMTFDNDIINKMHDGVAGATNNAGSTRSGFTNSSIEETYFQADFIKDVDFWNITSLMAGIKYRRGDVHRETGRTIWTTPEGAEYQWARVVPTAQETFSQHSASNQTGGFQANVFPMIDFDLYRNFLVDNMGEPTRIYENNKVFNVGEEVKAAYLQANFELDSVRGNFGVRVVSTNQFGQSSDKFTFLQDYYDESVVDPVSNPEGVLPKEQREKEIIQSNLQSNSYTDVLPSFNIAWDMTDKIVIRGAVAKVISRPSYNDIGAEENLTFTSDEYANDRAVYGAIPGWTGDGGNKNLKPFEAWQFDLGLEWYYKDGSGAGIALFRKNVDNFIVPLVIDTTRQIGEETVSVMNYSTSANGSDAVSQGVEFFVQHSFDSGFGLSANYTLNDTNSTDVSLDGTKVGESPLVGSADYQTNMSAYYENDVFSVRASYNKRGEVVGGIYSGMNTYTEAYDQVDVNASYELIENLNLTASVINLTESEFRTHLGDDTSARLFSSEYSGRRFYLGLDYSF